MDANGQNHEGFSQDECVEWVENKSVDLRQLARSPHMPVTPSLLATQTTFSHKDRKAQETPDTLELVKQLDKNYSPKQEVNNILDTLKHDSEESAHNAPTQPHENVARMAAPLGMRHRRRHRETSAKKQPKKLKRKALPNAGRERGRPRSSGSQIPVESGDRPPAVPTGSDQADFERLLKELDRPDTTPRVPLHPAKVNLPVREESNKSVTKVPPLKVPRIENRSGLSLAVPTAHAAPKYSNAQTISNPYPKHPTVLVKPTSNAAISRNDDVRNREVQNTQIMRPDVPSKPPSNAAAHKVHNGHGREGHARHLMHPSVLTMTPSNVATQSIHTVNNRLGQYRKPAFTDAAHSAPKMADATKLHNPYPQNSAPAPMNSQSKMAILAEKRVQNRPVRLTDAIQSVPNEANATKLSQHTAPETVPVNSQKKMVIKAENDVQNRRLSAQNIIAVVQEAAVRAIGTPTAKSTDLLSPSILIGDELELNEEDWAKMDALTSKAESRVSNASPVKNEAYSTTDWNTIKALDETLARARGHPSVSETVATADTIKKDDEFDDFPVLDFDDLDKQIAQRSSAVASNPGTTFDLPGNVRTAPSPDVAIRNPVMPTFDPQNSFIAFSRYKVIGTEVDNKTYTTTLFVKAWSATMLEEQNQQSIHRLSTLERLSSLPRLDADKQRADGCIFLRGEWYHTHMEAGDLVHLCSLSGKYRTDLGALPVVLHTNPPHGSYIDDDLVLVVHPDRLIPPTAISETVTCSRRAVLRLRLGSTGFSSKAALFGTMRHELFERCMSNQDFSWPTAKSVVQNIVRRNAESLVGCGVKDAEAREEVLRVVPQIQRFAADFTSFQGAAIKRQRQPSLSNAYGSRLKGNGIQPDMHFVANSVQATEESIVCPELGLKGYLDVTVSAMTHPLSSTVCHQASKSVEQPQTSLASIELKTGHNQNPQNAHMAQLALYTMMLRVRRGSQTHSSSIEQGVGQKIGAGESGMLLYLNHEAYRALHVSPMPNEIKSLIGQRNLVASELSRASRARGIVLNYEKGTSTEATKEIELQNQLGPSVNLLPASPAALPEVLATSHDCSRCYVNRECMTYAAAQMKAASSMSFQGVDKSHVKLLHRLTGHLSQDDLQYFQDWDRLIDLEADASTFMTTTAWLRCSQDQEKVSGKCLSSMVLDEVSTMMANDSDPDTSKDRRSALIVLERSNDSALTTPLSRLNIESGSLVIISTDATTLHLSSSISGTPLGNACHRVHRFRHRMSIVRGVADSVDQKRLTIRASRDELKQLSHLNQEYVESHSSSSNGSPSSRADGLLRFRIDKDDVSTGIGTLRQNLIQLLTSDVQPTETNDAKAPVTRLTPDLVSARGDRLSWLRDVIIRLRSPSFDETLRAYMFDSSRSNRSGHHPAAESEFFSLVAEFSELNGDQRNAVEKIMCAKDYALIQGLPGTGKTSTIAFVARLLAAHGKRILITSYTHAAVDNLMVKLMESFVASTSGNLSPPLVRVGRKSACHPSVHSILVPAIATAKEAHRCDRNGESVDDLPSSDSLSNVISSAQIIGVSALTVPRSSLLMGQHFDVVIVDEAGQISQPAILGALMAADSFVLVGDHMQLPPLVTSEVAEKGGYNISMLKRLADKHPSSVAQLTLQYRMHGAICQLCNDIVYGGKLRCANDVVEKSLLRLPGFPSAILKHAAIDPIACWMTDVIDPSQPVVFVDTDSIRSHTANSQSAITPLSLEGACSLSTYSGLERRTGKKGKGNIVNDTEAVLVRQVVHGLLECGMATSQIGVICPFLSQLRLLDQNKSMEEWKSKGLELSTIDRYQGRDKPAIIISFVRSNTSGNSGRLLEDFRRLNVAVSRAKRKLVMIGSFTTLNKGSDVLRPVLQNMRRRNQIVILPEDALQRYKMT